MGFWRLVGGLWNKPGRPTLTPSPTPAAPNAPTGLVVTTTSNTSAGLAWTAATLPTGATAVTGYRVYVNNVAFATLGNFTSYSLTRLGAGTGYPVAVTALNAIGESAKSTAATATTTNTAAVPNAPASLIGSVLSDTSVSLTWAAASVATGAPAVTGYKVYRGPVLAATLGAVTTTTLTGLTAGTGYAFYVVPLNTNGSGAASPTRVLTTTVSSAKLITHLPTNPAGLSFGDDAPSRATDISAYYTPGAMITSGRIYYDDQRWKDMSAAGGHVLIYIDPMIDNSYGRYHDKLLNASEFGPAVPRWPGDLQANVWGYLTDFRVGSVLQSKLEAVLELVVAENPYMAGFFLDDCGSRCWFPLINWDTWSPTDQQAYRDGAIAICQAFRNVCDRHGLIVIANGTWTASTTVAANGGGYPTMNMHGCSLLEGGVVEHHDGQVAYFGPYAAAAGTQWGAASTVTGPGKPLCFAIMATQAGLTEFRNAGTYAWVSYQSSSGSVGDPTYANPGPPFTAFHPIGLASSTSG